MDWDLQDIGSCIASNSIEVHLKENHQCCLKRCELKTHPGLSKLFSPQFSVNYLLFVPNRLRNECAKWTNYTRTAVAQNRI